MSGRSQFSTLSLKTFGSTLRGKISPVQGISSSRFLATSSSRDNSSASAAFSSPSSPFPQNLTNSSSRQRVPSDLKRRYQSTSTTAGRVCPQCSTHISPAVSPCPSCSALIPIPSGLSLHSLLAVCEPIPSSASSTPYDIPAELAALPARGFDLAPRDLRNRMLVRQRDLHPDKFGSKGEKVVSLAKELSGRVNMAYETLADPLKRAEYILSVHDLPIEETDSLTDPMLLAEIMEAREELEEAQTEEEVDGLRQANEEKVQATISSLKSAFSAEPPDLKEAKTLAVQLKYWMSLEAAAKEWTPEKGAGPSAGSSFSHS